MGPGNPEGEGLCLLGVGTRPAEVDGLAEQVQPPFEVLIGEGVLLVHQLVGPERVAGISGLAQEESAPVFGQLREVL